jgi:hypothetical protein
MLTNHVPSFISQITGYFPPQIVAAFETLLGQCDAPNEHRGPLIVTMDGGDRVDGRLQHYLLPRMCLAEVNPAAAITAINTSGVFSGPNCLSDCVTGGLALLVRGPAALQETRITKLYVGALTDLCGNPLNLGMGVEPIRFEVTDASPDPGDASLCKVKAVVWNGSSYETTGDDFIVADFTTNAEFQKRWENGYQGWCVDKGDRITITILTVTYDVRECVWVETKARFIEFSLTDAMVDQKAPATVTKFWGADDRAPSGTPVEVSDRLDKISTATAGFTGFAVYDEQTKEYVIVAPNNLQAGDQVFRFELEAPKAFNANGVGKLLDGAGTKVGSPVTFHDTVGEWRGETGYQGWCATKSDAGGRYEILFLEGQARWLALTLSADMSGGLATATINNNWGRPPNGKDLISPGINASDSRGLFPRARSGAKGLAVWDDKTNKYELQECQSQAGAAEVSYDSIWGLNEPSKSCTTLSFWGSQQDVQNPGNFSAQDRAGIYQHWSSGANAQGITVYDSATSQYVLVFGQRIAHAVQVTIPGKFNGGEVVGTVDAYWGGTNPGATVKADDSLNFFRGSQPDSKAIGLWDHNDLVGIFRAIQCETKAGVVQFATSEDFPDEGSAVMITAPTLWFGSQQDTLEPDPVVTQVEDSAGLFRLALDGALGYSLYDAEDDKYHIIQCETAAEHVIFKANTQVSGPNEFNGDRVVNEWHHGQDPAIDKVTLDIRNPFELEYATDEKGFAILDHQNSKATGLKYIAIGPKGVDPSKVRYGVCTTAWIKASGNDPAYVMVKEVADRQQTSGTGDTLQVWLLGTKTSGSPGTSFGDPNLEAGNMIAFVKATDGEFVCVSDYMDDKIGTVKMSIDVPGGPKNVVASQGWEIMDGVSNSSKGSGYDAVGNSSSPPIPLSDGPNAGRFPMGTKLPFGTKHGAGEVGGGRCIAQKQLKHGHKLESSDPIFVFNEEAPGLGIAEVMRFAGDGRCMHLAYDENRRDMPPPDPKADEECKSQDEQAPECDLDHEFGPVNIINPYLRLVYLERIDNSQQ